MKLDEKIKLLGINKERATLLMMASIQGDFDFVKKILAATKKNLNVMDKHEKPL